jgi:hypothetical protein
MYDSFFSQLMQHLETTAIIVSFSLKYVDNVNRKQGDAGWD